MRNIYCVLPALLITSAVFAQPTQEPVRLTDLLKIKTVGDIHLNKDGTVAVFTLTTIEPDTTAKGSKWDYKYVNQLYLVPSDGSAPPRQLTTAKEGAAQPAWSPDGKQLAFVRAVDGKPQVFLLPLDGGEPLQLTRFRYGASSPKWSPDGKEVLFAARINLPQLVRDSALNPSLAVPAWPDEKPGFTADADLQTSTAKADPDGNMDQVRAWLAANVSDHKAKVVNKLNFQDEMEVNPETSFTHWFIQSAQPADATHSPSGSADGAHSQYIPGPIEVTHGFFSYNSADYSPDGKFLYFVAHIDSTQDPDRDLEAEIWFADRDGGHLHKVLGEKGKVFGNPRVSPDGAWMAYTVSPISFVSVPQLYFQSLTGNAPAIHIAFDRAPGGFSWTNDDRYLYFIAQSNGGAPLYRVQPTSAKVDQLFDYNTGTTAYSLENGHLVFARTQPSDPSEIFTADASGQHTTIITAFNADWLSHRRLSMPEKHSFRNPLGQTIEYWVMKPTGYTEGKHYPLLLDIHGGPSAMWGPGEASMWHEFQYFCGHGYGVVYCNPRGSGGYGLDFLRSNIKDWGTGPTFDVLSALDKAVAEGWADTSKLVVSGGSYAGYLTAWIVGHDHRFKAACAQRGVYDLSTFFGEGNAWRLVPNYFGGYPWDPATKAILQRESPITYVANITTPLIIFHGESDRRTGFVGGEMLYRSLKVLGRPVEYVRHPGATHELTRSGDNRQRMDQMLRTYEFFDRFIKH